MVQQRFSKAVALQRTARNFTKNGVHVRPDCRSAESSDVFKEKPWRKLLFNKVAGLESITAI